MSRETAIVTRLAGDYAWVSAQRQSSCGHCAAKAGCGTQVLGQVLGQRATEIKAFNAIKAQVGEQIEVEVPDQLILSASTLIYLLPVVSLLLMALVGQNVGSQLNWHVDLVSILFGALGLFLGLAVVRFMTRQTVYARKHRPVIVARHSAAPLQVAPIHFNH